MILRLRQWLWRVRKLPGPPPGVTAEDAGDLYDRALEAIDCGLPDEALKLANVLQGYRFTGAWEVRAIALWERGEPEAAITALREGLTKMQVWRNGHLLGIYLSDERRYEEALVAFDASKSMYGAQPDWSDYNKAIVLNRMNRSDEAIALLEEVAARARDDHDSELARRASQFLTDLTAPSAATRRSHRRRPNARRRRHFDTLLED